MTQITIFGAGAMGCLLGGCLMQAGYDVQLIARGEQLRALQTEGLHLQCANKQWSASVNVVDSSAANSPADILFITLKSHQLPQSVEEIVSLIGPDTIIIPALNGIPWWYFHKSSDQFSGKRIELLDPKGVVSAAIPSDQVIGCVNYLAGTVVRPGVVEYVDYFEKSLVLGELDNQCSARLDRVVNILQDAGCDPVKSTNIREAIWHKLWGNIAFNPISALTHATMDTIAEGYDDTDLILAVMNEARHVAEKLGITFSEAPRARIAAVAKRRGHKTSMLQDMEAGRVTEIDAIVGAVREIAMNMQEGTPYLNALYSLVRQKERFFTPPAKEVEREVSSRLLDQKAFA